MRIASLTLLGGLAGCGALQETVEHSTLEITEDYERIEVLLDAGDVSIHVDDGNVVSIDRTARFRAAPPVLTAAIQDGVLTIIADCKHCSVDHVIRLPSSAPLTVQTGAGDLLLERLDHDVHAHTSAGNIGAFEIYGHTMLDTDAGDIHAEHITGDLFASSQAGDVAGWDLRSPMLSLESSAGDVWAELLERPADVQLDSQAGDVAATLPAGRYNIDAASQAGKVRIDGLTDDTQADARLTLHSSAGDVRATGH